jgi:hypothetical protein
MIMTDEELLDLPKEKLVKMIRDLMTNKGVCEAGGECGGEGESNTNHMASCGGSKPASCHGGTCKS